ncbi:MAG TPA: DUF1615 domain-containing protein [Steroidobacteraceae bacterium]|jgi:hypothetical protein|nr:DUF1615 domain-containing protein [Steroidobacteraceae bacterium]
MRRLRGLSRGFGVLALAALTTLAGCASPPRPPVVDPDAVRAEIARLMPANVPNRPGWAIDIFAAFEALGVPPTTQNICAVLAVAQQESNLQVDPVVPGLPAIARREIESRAAGHGVPKLVVSAALALPSPNGMSYSERLDRARTEKDLSEIFEDFIHMVPLGERLFADLNPVRTGGPMQVSIAFAEKHAKGKRYPYPQPGSIRREVFTRRGGLYFGIAHLLDYPASYDDLLYRFADYNAGHYASRNVAFQNAVSIASGTKLVLDGDVLRHGGDASTPSKTELAVRKLASRIDMSDAQIRNDLEREDDASFEKTKVYSRVFALAEKTRGRALPRAMVPQIRLQSPKITRKLTTEWFARRVDSRYQQCLARAK